MRILLVEDNQRQQGLLTKALRGAGYGVDAIATLADLVNSARAIRYNLLIVEPMLPDGDGLDGIRSLRADSLSVPILIMSAMGSVEDRLAGFAAGADDYMAKPFYHAELLARVRALLRRQAEVAESVLRVGKTELDEAKAQVRCSGQPIYVRPSERRLLALLMRRHGNVVARQTIEATASEFSREISPNAINAQVSRLRKALTGVGSGILMETVRGVGYILRPAGEPYA
jgi:two-component system, OmpR family, response regulator